MLMEKIEFLGVLREQKGIFFATTGNGFCKSYKIILAMFKLISSLFLRFPYHQALKFAEILFLPFFFFFPLEIFFVCKSLKGEKQVLANILWRELSIYLDA